MSGADELRECIRSMWHCATTKCWNPRMKNHKPLWCRDVLWCCLLFTEKAEAQKSVLSLAMEGFALVWAMGHGVGLER